MILSVLIFLFQAEDGIRDATVTGVQTCALPISGPLSCAALSAQDASVEDVATDELAQEAEAQDADAQDALAQDAVFQEAEAHEAEAHEALFQEASDAAALAQLAASNRRPEPPAGSDTT